MSQYMPFFNIKGLSISLLNHGSQSYLGKPPRPSDAEPEIQAAVPASFCLWVHRGQLSCM